MINISQTRGILETHFAPASLALSFHRTAPKSFPPLHPSLFPPTHNGQEEWWGENVPYPRADVTSSLIREVPRSRAPVVNGSACVSLSGRSRYAQGIRAFTKTGLRLGGSRHEELSRFFAAVSSVKMPPR